MAPASCHLLIFIASHFDISKLTIYFLDAVASLAPTPVIRLVGGDTFQILKLLVSLDPRRVFLDYMMVYIF